jgi:2,3,4,5-tetrahydropyridine-2,6-dicarboxylate N-succinyltransferase
VTAQAETTIVDDLESGRLRAAEPDPSAPEGWRVRPEAKAAILALLSDRTERSWEVGPFQFRDRASMPPRDLSNGRWRIVPGGTSIRTGAHLEPGVVVLPPSFINAGAWIGEDTMVDSHVLLGSCAQIGARVHLSAGVLVGGVLEPPNGRPVIVEDDAFVGAGSVLLDGVLIHRRAVLAAGVTLTGTSRLFDLVAGRVLEGTAESPLAVPEGAVVIPGTRRLDGAFAEQHGLSAATAIIVKQRDPGTDARVALEQALR